MAVGISSNWLWNFVVVMITPSAIDNLKWKAYLIFMCTNLAFIPLVYFCYPETSNLTLEGIDYLFTSASETPPSRGFVSGALRPQDSVLLGFNYLSLKSGGDEGVLEQTTASRNNSVAGRTEEGAEQKEYYGSGKP